MLKAFSAPKIFTGETWLEEHVMLVENDFIIDLLPATQAPNLPVQSFTNCMIVPSFIDLQIYGGNGALLSVSPTADTLYKMYSYCKAGGAHYFLPTVATNTYPVFYNCINAVKAYWEQGGQGVLGLHIEGPWINKIKRGAHIEDYIHSPSLQQVKQLLDYGKGVIKIITLAPEVCSLEVIKLIREYEVIISAGHSNATYAEATHAFNSGISLSTHLYNAMSPLQHREPGMVGAILNSPSAQASIIADGHHVDYAAISIAKKLMNERLFLITDAVAETSEGPYPHKLQGDKYVSKGILSGSALTMAKAVKNCVIYASISLEEAIKMASVYPAEVVGLHHQIGFLKKGYKASFTVLHNALNVVEL